jgi:ABC-type transport system substrate-binding protein
MKMSQQFRYLMKQRIGLLVAMVVVILIATATGSLAFAESLTVKAEGYEISVRPSSWVLTADQWEIARSGESLLSLTVLNNVVSEWLFSVQGLQKDTQTNINAIIDVQYPNGEEGEFWVQELTDWLVALGIPSRFISLTPVSESDDEIKFQLK